MVSDKLIVIMNRGTNLDLALSNTLGLDEELGLVSAAKRGDLAAFEQLVRRHQSRIFNLVHRITGGYEDACDVTQEVFVAAFTQLATFRGKSKFSTWLTAIAVNRARNRLAQIRRQEVKEAVSLDDPVETANGSLSREIASNEPSPQERLESKDAQRAVQDCINRLPAEFREVVVLRDLQDFAYDEIATVLKLREGTVKSRLSRAREAVKQCLQRVMGEL
jgi:RNA polymerase sigma-70 factor (ECF subfamily)